MNRLTAILVTLLFAHAAGAAGITVSLHKEVYAGGRLIVASDVARVTGDDALAAKASAVTLGTTPTTLSAFTVTRESVLKRLMTNGISRDEVEFTGEALTLVYSATVWGVAAGVKTEGASAPAVAQTAADTPVAAAGTTEAAPAKPAAAAPAPANNGGKTFAQRLTEEVRYLVADKLGIDSADISVDVTGESPKYRVLPKDLAQFVGCFDTGTMGGPLGRRTYMVNATVAGVDQRDLTVTMTISRMVTVAVAGRRLAAGTVIEASDLRLERRAFTTEVNDYFTDLESLVGMAPNKQVIEAGKEIRKSGVTPGIIVRKGELVECVKTVGGHTVKTHARAMEDGTKGQLIRVEREVPAAEAGNRPEKKPFMARVLGKGQCSIESAS